MNLFRCVVYKLCLLVVLVGSGVLAAMAQPVVNQTFTNLPIIRKDSFTSLSNLLAVKLAQVSTKTSRTKCKNTFNNQSEACTREVILYAGNIQYTWVNNAHWQEEIIEIPSQTVKNVFVWLKNYDNGCKLFSLQTPQAAVRSDAYGVPLVYEYKHEFDERVKPRQLKNFAYKLKTTDYQLSFTIKKSGKQGVQIRIAMLFEDTARD